MLAQPSLERHEPCTVFAAFHFCDDWRCPMSEQINIHVVTTAAKSAATGKRIAFGIHADC